MNTVLASFGAAFILALMLTPLAKRAAWRFGAVDAPDQNLKDHAVPTPYFGGVSVFMACVASVVLTKLYFHHTLHGVIAILSGGFIIFLLGLADDLWDLSPWVKLFGQTVAAVILLLCGVRIHFLSPDWLDWVVTVVWVVGVTNAFNLIDVMDGLASGVALLAALTLCVIGLEADKINNYILCAAVAGASLAFLFHNFPRAGIFLGDAGALFLGFTLAAVSMGGNYSRNNEVALICPLLILGVPIFETLILMTVRLAKGMSPFRGSHDHTAHRLMRAGLSPKATLFLIYGASAFLCAAAYASIHLKHGLVFLLYAAIGFSGMVFGVDRDDKNE